MLCTAEEAPHILEPLFKPWGNVVQHEKNLCFFKVYKVCKEVFISLWGTLQEVDRDVSPFCLL